MKTNTPLNSQTQARIQQLKLGMDGKSKRQGNGNFTGLVQPFIASALRSAHAILVR